METLPSLFNLVDMALEKQFRMGIDHVSIWIFVVEWDIKLK